MKCRRSVESAPCWSTASIFHVSFFLLFFLSLHFDNFPIRMNGAYRNVRI